MASADMPGLKLSIPGRRAAIVAGALLTLLLVALLAAGWYYASLLHDGALKPDYSPDELNLRVVSVEGDRIVLAERPGEDVDSLDDDNLWGLEGQSGYGHAGAVLAVNGREVTREFELLSGTIAAGDYARLDSFAYKGDPLSARGLAFHSVSVPSEVGSLPAWKLDGRTGTWVIFVHGWRSDREEALRILPTVSSLGLHSLVITYRNDEGAPASEDALIRWGGTEWRDLEAALDYARAEGASSIILYGYSMGGGIAMRFLQQSDRAGLVNGAVLDAPVLDFSAVVDSQADRRHIPGIVVGLAKQLAAWRFDLDWRAADHMQHLERVNIPILLFHGDEDDLAPIAMSERLAARRPDIVTFVVAKGAGHVRAWNVGPEAYEHKVRDFLIGLVASQAGAQEFLIPSR